MSIVKSFSVGDGDMFYIDHNTDNFTVIDCYLSSLSEEDKESVISEILGKSKNKGITRFISTHPDEDHIGGLKYFQEKIGIYNFYCVANEATKKDKSEDFDKYCELRDSDKAFYIYQGCSRKWMNRSDEVRGCAGINIQWPITNNEYFKEAIEKAKNGESPNNISPIVTYGIQDGATFMWMGDLETDFMDNVKESLKGLPKADILFAPHHGRDSGKIPLDILNIIDPQIIVIGEAPSKNLNYYSGYNTITQNSAGAITFDCVDSKVHIYVSNENYEVDYLDDEGMSRFEYYIGTLKL